MTHQHGCIDPTIKNERRQITESVRNTPSEVAPTVQTMLDSSVILEETCYATLMVLLRLEMDEKGLYDVDGANNAI